MNSRCIGFVAALLAILVVSKVSDAGQNPQRARTGKPRLVVLTDLGGDPDDLQSLIRLLVYANEFDIEGLISAPSGKPNKKPQPGDAKPEQIRDTIKVYGQVRDNLLKHAPGYPEAAALLSTVKVGNPAPGMDSVGEGKDTEGSRWIIELVDREDRRPLNVAIWGGGTDLAQALWRVEHDRSPEELAKFVTKLRIHDIDAQTDANRWVMDYYTLLFYVLDRNLPHSERTSAVFRGMYIDGDESLTSRDWIHQHVRDGHGPLGALYPDRTATLPNQYGGVKEGDTPSWFYFLPLGLSDPEHPEWGGWGGRFVFAGNAKGNKLWLDGTDSVYGLAPDGRSTVWRWRPAYQADFQARMDWCVKPRNQANHPPQPVVDGDRSRGILRKNVKRGERVQLDASGSKDPDGDKLSYRWFFYQEAGNYRDDLVIEHPLTPRPVVVIPKEAGPNMEIHVILEVTDNGTPNLTRYRRVIFEPKGGK